MDKPNETNETLTHDEVCELLGVSRTTLWTWRKERNFPTARWDMATKGLRFDRDAVDAWVKDNEEE